jgi:hypothetical protein
MKTTSEQRFTRSKKIILSSVHFTKQSKMYIKRKF